MSTDKSLKKSFLSEKEDENGVAAIEEGGFCFILSTFCCSI